MRALLVRVIEGGCAIPINPLGRDGFGPHSYGWLETQSSIHHLWRTVNWEERPKPPVTRETDGSFCQVKRGWSNLTRLYLPACSRSRVWEKRGIKLLSGFTWVLPLNGAMVAPSQPPLPERERNMCQNM